MQKRHIVCEVHAGLGVSMAFGSPSAADKNIHNAHRPNLFMMERDRERVCSREG